MDVDLRSIVDCEITTQGALHELEDISQLYDDAQVMKILYDNRGRVVGPEERCYPRWHEWKLIMNADRTKRASSVKINHIYKALLNEKSLSPNCEGNWDEKGINPPPRGWREVWGQFLGLLGTPRDIKTRFKYLHRGLWTQHKLAFAALQRRRLVCDKCILCRFAQGTHLHFVNCGELDRSFEWLEDFAALTNVTLRMTTEDKIYGTMNNGEIMPKGLRLFYSILFKHWWIGYTTKNKEGTAFDDKALWISAMRRLKTVLHEFEIDSQKRFELIHTRLHALLGYGAEAKKKALEKELDRRNEKLAPLGVITHEEKTTELKRSFKWKDVANIVNVT